MWTNPAPGKVIYTASSAAGTELLPLGAEGSLVTLTLTINPGAAAGPSPLNLLAALGMTATAAFDNGLNELALTPAPSNAADDSVDGLLTVEGTVPDPPPAQNPGQPLDTDNDGRVTAADVLAVINYLNRGLPQDASVLYVEPGMPVVYGDVNGDRRITAQDVLVVINHLNAQTVPSGEGEAREAAIGEWLEEADGDEVWELLAANRLRGQRTQAVGELLEFDDG
jgi:hypothetical protein